MPLDAQGEWSRDKVVPAAEILERIDAVFPLEPAGTDGAEPATRFVYRDGIGDVGVIASVSEPFCDELRPCAAHRRGPVPHVPVRARGVRPARRAAGRAPASTHPTSTIASRPRSTGAVGTKWAGHHIGAVDFVRPDRSMSQIGG